MTPIEAYQSELQTAGFVDDPAQRKAVGYTQSLYDRLLPEYRRRYVSPARHLRRFLKTGTKSIKGLYFWGGVGRGKTYIADTFFDCLPFARKKRMHFHRFMRMIHQQLKNNEHVQEPLRIVADNIAAEAMIICFDEFHVADITDAMLLGGLLDALFERGVVLVATSNDHPDRLYQDGLQRDRFLPAIDLIKEYTHVVNVDNDIDYRLRYLDKAEIYHYPLDERADAMLSTNYEYIAPDAGRRNSTIEIEGRKIRTVRNAVGVVWFDFRAICDGPRGPADYIEIARQFQTVLISGVPVLGDDQLDMADRFMTMTDEFYDRNVKLILTAAGPPEDLYQGQRLRKKYQRTVSRLQEMQSHEYLAGRHLPD